METAGYPQDGGRIDLRVYARDARFLPRDWKDDVEAKRDAKSWVHYEETRAGALGPEKRSRAFAGSYVVSGVVYGLVNVRTDGETVMCATMNEAENSWNVKSFPARFGAPG